MILMEIDGVEGNSMIADHEKWIKFNDLDWSAGRQISTASGDTSNRGTQIVHCADIVVSREVDSNSAKLFELVCGKKGKTIKIHFLVGAGDAVESYSEWTLEDALISNYSISAGDDEGRGEETMNINFVTIEIKSIPREKDESASGPYPVKFDRESGTKV